MPPNEASERQTAPVFHAHHARRERVACDVVEELA